MTGWKTTKLTALLSIDSHEQKKYLLLEHDLVFIFEKCTMKDLAPMAPGYFKTLQRTSHF